MEDGWLEVSIETTAEGMEPLTAWLTARDIIGLVIQDETDFAAFEAVNRPFWDETDQALADTFRGVNRVQFYLTDDEEGRDRLGGLRAELERFCEENPWFPAPLDWRISSLRQEDWAESWKAYYKPFPVGQRLYIQPEWLRQEPVPDGRIPLLLDPGLTFGTGAHATTRMCLATMENYIPQNGPVLDLGCGSGILSIAALKLGATNAFGCDIDPRAVRVAGENATLNRVENRLSLFCGDILTNGDLQSRLAGQYPLVLANIVADVIIALAPAVPGLLAKGGVFLCSGIIEGRQDDVKSALAAQGLAVFRTETLEGWFCLAAHAPVTPVLVPDRKRKDVLV